jgi:putative PIN family toxin of toxin-antitoxin system
MNTFQVVLDTNIIVSALRSRSGAASKLLRLIGTNRFEIHISIPLVFEYEDVLKRKEFQDWWSFQDAEDVVDYICSTAYHHKIWYLWRPYLSDAKDDLVLELALKANVKYIITYNVKDFKQAESLGIIPITPENFLHKLRKIDNE